MILCWGPILRVIWAWSHLLQLLLHEIRKKKTVVGVKPSSRGALANWECKQRESRAFYSSAAGLWGGSLG